MKAYVKYTFTGKLIPKANMGGTLIKHKNSTFIISGYETAELF